MDFTFQKAQRKKSKLRLGLTGASGSGKTYGALLIAKGMGGKIAVIDTEKGSASLYTDLVDFDVLELQPPYTPERFTSAINAAGSAEYDIIIVDSITHEWNGKGGCLELVDDLGKSKFRGNSWAAWNEVTPRHRAFIDTITQSDAHIITTMRSKTETAQQESLSGKKQVVKLGMKNEQRDGTEYEFTTVLDIVHDGHYAVASKDRTGIFTDVDPRAITVETGKLLMDWLEKGIILEPEKPVEPTKTTKPTKPIEQDSETETVADNAEYHIQQLQKCKKMSELSIAWQNIPKHLMTQCNSFKDEMKIRLTK